MQKFHSLLMNRFHDKNFRKELEILNKRYPIASGKLFKEKKFPIPKTVFDLRKYLIP